MTDSLDNVGLYYVSDFSRGYFRKPWGQGFTYVDESEERLTDDHKREWIKSLAIPPAWSDVWISKNPNAHILATGRDDAGRKQYIYHPEWEAVRGRRKFASLIEFAKRLPQIRGQVQEDLGRDELDRQKVLAAVVRVLDATGMRVGNAQSAKDRSTYGITTIRTRHVHEVHESADNADAEFDFTGKGGSEQHYDLHDPAVVAVIRECVEVPGYEIFKFIDEGGEKQDVQSHHVNEYLHEITAKQFTAKDFRTWHGTVEAVRACGDLASTESPESGGELSADQFQADKKEILACVSEALGNTPKIAESHYVHPGVLEAHAAGRTGSAVKEKTTGPFAPEGLSAVERRTFRLLSTN